MTDHEHRHSFTMQKVENGWDHWACDGCGMTRAQPSLKKYARPEPNPAESRIAMAERILRSCHRTLRDYAEAKPGDALLQTGILRAEFRRADIELYFDTYPSKEPLE